MKISRFALSVIFPLSLVLLAPVNIFAHPPSDIRIDFNSTTKVLKVDLVHDSRDVKKHFIESVIVWVGNKKMITQEMLQQADLNGQKASYIVLDAAPAARISVEGECNRFGKLKKDFTLP